MSYNDVSLTSGMRANLISLQSTVTLLNRTQQRLSTGKEVNSALDNPVNFFTGQALNSRASDLAGYKDGMSNAIQTIQAANEGITGVTTLINAAKAIASTVGSLDATGRTNAVTQYNNILTQIDNMTADSSFQGVNLISGSQTMTVTFGSGTTDNLTFSGANFVTSNTGASGLNMAQANGTNWGNGVATTELTAIDTALSRLRSFSQSLSSTVSIVQARQDFTVNLANVLTTGADHLTLADTNQEGANMLMLQTRQSLGTTALSLSAQAAQSVLRLFG